VQECRTQLWDDSYPAQVYQSTTEVIERAPWLPGPAPIQSETVSSYPGSIRIAALLGHFSSTLQSQAALFTPTVIGHQSVAKHDLRHARETDVANGLRTRDHPFEARDRLAYIFIHEGD
jgi:hypothetical protein